MRLMYSPWSWNQSTCLDLFINDKQLCWNYPWCCDHVGAHCVTNDSPLVRTHINSLQSAENLSDPPPVRSVSIALFLNLRMLWMSSLWSWIPVNVSNLSTNHKWLCWIMLELSTVLTTWDSLRDLNCVRALHGPENICSSLCHCDHVRALHGFKSTSVLFIYSDLEILRSLSLTLLLGIRLPLRNSL